jgi:hypothetical protein
VLCHCWRHLLRVGVQHSVGEGHQRIRHKHCKVCKARGGRRRQQQQAGRQAEVVLMYSTTSVRDTSAYETNTAEERTWEKQQRAGESGVGIQHSVGEGH